MKKILNLNIFVIFVVILIGCNSTIKLNTKYIVDQLKNNGIDGKFDIKIMTSQEKKEMENEIANAKTTMEKEFAKNFIAMRYLNSSCAYKTNELYFLILDFEKGKAEGENIDKIVEFMSAFSGKEEIELNKMIKDNVVIVFFKGYEKYGPIFEKILN